MSARCPVVPRVEAVLRQMKAGQMSSEVAASRLHMSRNSLWRRLAAEGEAWNEMLERERRRRCEEAIASGTRAGKRLADICGYSSTAGFYIAFNNWYGFSFAEFKRRQAA